MRISHGSSSEGLLSSGTSGVGFARAAKSRDGRNPEPAPRPILC